MTNLMPSRASWMSGRREEGARGEGKGGGRGSISGRRKGRGRQAGRADGQEDIAVLHRTGRHGSAESRLEERARLYVRRSSTWAWLEFGGRRSWTQTKLVRFGGELVVYHQPSTLPPILLYSKDVDALLVLGQHGPRNRPHVAQGRHPEQDTRSVSYFSPSSAALPAPG